MAVANSGEAALIYDPLQTPCAVLSKIALAAA